jgi:membrane protein DedA with SNARE-associated domain
MEALQSAIEFVGGLSYVGLGVTGFLAQAIIPVPEEVVLIALGYLLSVGDLTWYFAFPAIIIGVLLGDLAIFLLSYHGNKSLRFTYEKIFSHIVPIDEPFIRRHVKTIIVVSRFVIHLRFLGPFFAGYIKTPIKTFIAYDFPAAVVYAIGYIGIGMFFSQKIDMILSGVNLLKNIVFVIVGIALVVSITKGLKKLVLNWYYKTESREYKESEGEKIKNLTENR